MLLVGRATVTLRARASFPMTNTDLGGQGHWLAPPSGTRHGVQSSKIAKLLTWIAEPHRRLRIRGGFEDFDFPRPCWSRRSLGEGPTILHLHNLHGGYFDLRALPALSDLAPVVLTLHDQWAFTGHCAHSFGCDRWKTGCGDCPDLTIYPGIPKDRTAENFALKQEIFSRTRLYLSAPSRWLMDKAERSLLAPAVEEARIIPNGVDTNVFRPGDKAIERSRLGLPRRFADRAECRNRRPVGPLDRSTSSSFDPPATCAEEGLADVTLLFLGSERSSERRSTAFEVIHRPYEHDTRESPATTGHPMSICIPPVRTHSPRRPRIARLRCAGRRHRRWRDP